MTHLMAGRRACSAVLAIAAAMAIAAGGAAHAQGSGMAGSWRGFAQGVTFNLVVGADGSFSEQEVMGPMMTMQTGVIQPTGPGVVTFVVRDWEPKSHPVYHPTGTVGGYTTQEPNARPPGGTWRVRFEDPNVMTLQDVNLGGSVTFQRLR